ncbi:hypothetical protein EDD85DRAFT_949731 [Armillaria nabsnona]|nr:hypothetical protein EDD85DRAFT_949731 [Armillaria nabsnona]
METELKEKLSVTFKDTAPSQAEARRKKLMDGYQASECQIKGYANRDGKRAEMMNTDRMTTVTTPVPLPTSAAPRPSPIPITTAQRLPSTVAGTPVNSVHKLTLPERARSPGNLLSNADRRSSSYISKEYATFPPKHTIVEHIIQPQNSSLESTYDWLKDEIEFEEYLPSGDRTLRQEDAHCLETNGRHPNSQRISPETGEEEVLSMGWTKHTYSDGKPYFYHKIITDEWLYDRDIGLKPSVASRTVASSMAPISIGLLLINHHTALKHVDIEAMVRSISLYFNDDLTASQTYSLRGIFTLPRPSTREYLDTSRISVACRERL